MQPEIAILAGEVSGDLVGGALARELRRLRPDLSLWGMGSRHLAAAGVALLADSDRWGAIGVIEALKVYPELRFRIYPRIMEEIARRRPAAVILIDFGAFNVKVARRCKALGVPVLYYFPPGSWKRRGRLNPEIARITDSIATPFHWSAERLAALGARVTFVGHPLLELARPILTRAQFAARFGMEPGKPIIGLLPGSRSFEVEHNAPVMLDAAALLLKSLPEAQFVFGLASDTARRKVEEILQARREAVARIEEQAQQQMTEESDIDRQLTEIEGRLGEKARPRLITPEGVEVSADVLAKEEAARRFSALLISRFDLPPVLLAEGLTYEVMAHADVLLICSGTATLEAAIIGTPMVILYRGSKLMEMEAKLRRVRPEHIGMPSIIAGTRIVPEFIQNEATPEALAESAMKMLNDPAERARVKSALAEVRAILGEPGASERTARLALQLAGLLPA